MDKKFLGKKIAVIGAGVEGISTVNYLASQGAKITLLDRKTETHLRQGFGGQAEKLEKIKKLPIKLKFGGNYLSDLGNFDFIFRSPGVKNDLPEIIEAEK